jgi:hypothetical protein
MIGKLLNAAIPPWVKALIIGAVLVAIAGVIAAGYTYVTNLQERAITAERNEATTKAALQVEQTRNTQLHARIGEFAAEQVLTQQAINELARASSKNAAETIDAVRETLHKHDLAKLAEKKPGLVARRLTDGSNQRIRMLNAAGDVDGGGPGAGRPAPEVGPPPASETPAAPRAP